MTRPSIRLSSQFRAAEERSRVGREMNEPSLGRGSAPKSGAPLPVSPARIMHDCPPCAICGHRGRADRAPYYLTHGLVVWLCHAHRTEPFLTRRSGREFTERLSAVWAASGVLTVRRKEALEAHLRAVQQPKASRQKPGSYSWPLLRREAERRFAAGDPPGHVITELRQTYRDGPAMVPSVRTMRRWFTQARWLETAPSKRRASSRHATSPRGPASPRQPFVDLILTGVAYPTAPRPRHIPRGP